MSKSANKWSIFLALSALCVLLCLLVSRMPPRDVEVTQLFKVIGVVLPVTIAAMLFLTAAHELGHLLAARATGMSVLGFCVGPFRWTNKGGRWTFTWFDDMRVGGFVMAIPTNPEFDRRQYIAFFLGGPAGTIVMIALAFVLYRLVPGLVIVTVPLLCLSLLFALTIVPMRTGGIASDGHWLYSLLFNPEDAARRLSTARLFTMSQQDVPSHEWPREIVDSLQMVQGDTLESISARLFEISFAITVCDFPLAVRAADALESIYSVEKFVDTAGNLKAAVYLDIALVRAIVQRKAVQARKMLSKTGPIPEEFAFIAHEIMANVYAMEGDSELSREEVKKALAAATQTFKDKPRVRAVVIDRIERVLTAPPPLSGQEDS